MSKSALTFRTSAYDLLGVRRIATSSCYPSGHGGVERVTPTTTQMLAMVVSERQDDWGAQLPRVEFAYNNSVSTATGLIPNKVHMGRLPRLLLTIFDCSGIANHQSPTREQLAYCNLESDRQKPGDGILRANACLTAFRFERRYSPLSGAFRQVPSFVVDNWVSLYNTASTIRHVSKAGMDAKVLRIDFSLYWTGPCKILTADPCPPRDTPDRG